METVKDSTAAAAAWTSRRSLFTCSPCLIVIVLQLGVEGGLHGLQFARGGVGAQLVPESLQLGAKMGGLSAIQLNGVLFGGA